MRWLLPLAGVVAAAPIVIVALADLADNAAAVKDTAVMLMLLLLLWLLLLSVDAVATANRGAASYAAGYCRW